VALVRAHWGLGSKVLTGIFVRDPSAEEVEVFTRLQRAGASAAVAGQLLEVYYNTDIRALLPAIRARTAVLHREADSATRFELGREVATLIPGATLIPLPGTRHLFYQGNGSRSWRRCSASSARGRTSGRGSPAASLRWPG
jgi:pimeloyl-ACP methyl ester carboxylesterase